MAVSTRDRSFRGDTAYPPGCGASDDDSRLLVKSLTIAMMCLGVNVVEAYFCFDDRADEGIVRAYIRN